MKSQTPEGRKLLIEREDDFAGFARLHQFHRILKLGVVLHHLHLKFGVVSMPLENFVPLLEWRNFCSNQTVVLT